MSGKCVVDTSVIIQLFRADEYAIKLFHEAGSIYIPVIVVGELFYGAEKSTRKQENMSIIANFLAQYEVIEVGLPVAQAYGEIKAQLRRDRQPIPENDLWIAATAKAYQYAIITFDVHFSTIGGLQIIN